MNIVYKQVVGDEGDPKPGQVLITVGDGSLDFATGEAPQQADGDRLVASYLVEKENCVQVSLIYGGTVERFIVPDGRILAQRINQVSTAAIAGLISSIPVQTSLTNKGLTVPGLAIDFNRGQQGQLIRRNVLAAIRRNGSFRILKGITTAGEGDPFSAIPTRRIVDYAKYGVRSAANPYIGRLNNARVRAALKATLDGFLTRMVEDEALTGYELEVSATRAQEIAGEVSVVMTLRPTFIIDFIRVTMILK